MTIYHLFTIWTMKTANTMDKIGWKTDAELGANGTWLSVALKVLHPCPLQIKQWLMFLQRVPLDERHPRSTVFSAIEERVINLDFSILHYSQTLLLWTRCKWKLTSSAYIARILIVPQCARLWIGCNDSAAVGCQTTNALMALQTMCRKDL